MRGCPRSPTAGVAATCGCTTPPSAASGSPPSPRAPRSCAWRSRAPWPTDGAATTSRRSPPPRRSSSPRQRTRVSPMRPERTLGAAGSRCSPPGAAGAAPSSRPARQPSRSRCAFPDAAHRAHLRRRPHPEGTPAVLAELERAGAQATFFLVGEQVAAYPTLAAEIAAAGHEIGIHGYRHRCYSGVARVRSRPTSTVPLRRSARRPGSRAASTGRLRRLQPGGADARAPPLAATLVVALGTRLEARASAESIARRAARRLAGGEVVLLHDADFYSSPARGARPWPRFRRSSRRRLRRVSRCRREPVEVTAHPSAKLVWARQPSSRSARAPEMTPI